MRILSGSSPSLHAPRDEMSLELSAADEGERAGERVVRPSNLILDSRSAGGLPAARGRSWGGWPRGSIDGCWGRFAGDRPTAQAQK